MITRIIILLCLFLPELALADLVAEQNYDVEVGKGKILHLDNPASTVIAADPTIADAQVISPNMIYINAKGVGETTITAIDAKDNEILRAVVNVTRNISKLNNIVKTMEPDAKVKFQSIDGALIMSGDVSSPLQADEIKRIAAPFVKNGQTLVNMLHPLGSNQVMLKVKIAEVDRTELKHFGISLQNLSSASNFAFGMVNGRAISDLSNGGAFSRNSSNDNALFANYNNGTNNVNAVLDALEDNNLVTTLAEPNLTTQSGQAASFLAGGEIPVPTVTGSGANAQVGITYQPYGVKLDFTPTVLSKDRISLTVAPEVSSISESGGIVNQQISVPALLDRKASTTVELGSGQSFAIAGLIENDRSNDISKFPFLGDVPVLGALFRSNQFQHNQTELVIIVTPYIVGAVDSAKGLHSPTDGLEMPSDFERIVLGKLYKEYKPNDTSETPHLRGAAGYVLQ